MVISDIFGVCSATDKLIERMIAQGREVMLLDPYKGKRRHFLNEQQAYQAFTQERGHLGYYQFGLAEVKKYQPDIIIGFSAGANVVWRLAAEEGVSFQQALCFYPTQIRHFSELVPTSPLQLIFPNYEASFDVEAMAASLADTPNVSINMMPFGHGFMNPLSQHYQEEAEVLGMQYLDLI